MPERNVRLVIAGGGTGGHVLPAIAVIEELRDREALDDSLWLGSACGLEREAAAEAGIPFQAIPTGKLRRYLSARTIVDGPRVPAGIVRAWQHLRRFQPTVVFSTGGFVSVPTVIAAARQAPILTHEQTAILGMATRINARFADVLAISYDATLPLAQAHHANIVVTGNPVRASLRHGTAERGFAHWRLSADLPLIYVTGGARGASALNQRIAQLLPTLLPHCQIVHQTGPPSANSDAATLAMRRDQLSPELRERYRVVEFVHGELADTYAAASVILSRSGAGTVAEIAYLGKPAILIPLPGTGGDEQTRNARLLEEAGGAIVLPQSDASSERLCEILLRLLGDDRERARMGGASARVGRPDAASRLADALIALGDRSHNQKP